jgi:hypothetical protein
VLVRRDILANRAHHVPFGLRLTLLIGGNGALLTVPFVFAGVIRLLRKSEASRVTTKLI